MRSVTHRTRAHATRWRRGVTALVASATLAVSGVVATLPSASADTPAPDLARFGTISADKVQNDPGTTNGGYFPASNMIDGDSTTRWASGNGTDSVSSPWTAAITEDLGAPATITGTTIAWEAAYASGYHIEVATAAPDDPASWTTVYTTTTGTGGNNDQASFAPVEARYVRLDLDARASVGGHYYGYSIYTFSVWGSFDTPQVEFGSLSNTTAAGSAATVPLVLSAPLDHDATVHVTSTDGTATAGVDYTAVDEDVTIPTGATSVQVTVPTTAEGPLAPTRTLQLALSAPSTGLAVAPALSSATVSITPSGTLANTGQTKVLDDFESGVPSTYAVWANGSANNPVLSAQAASVPGDAADNHALVATVAKTSSYFGFTYEPKNADGTNILMDWSAYDGFSFWFLGKNTGKTFSFELHNRNASNAEQGFTSNVVDNVAGWRKITVLFKDLKAKSGNTLTRFNPSISTGFAVTLTNFAATGDYSFDDFTLYSRGVLLDDFEPPFTPGDAQAQSGWFSTDDGISVGVGAQDRGQVSDNHVLTGTYQRAADATGGLNDNLAYSQDWSSFRGIQFWWYASQSTEPATAETGAVIPVEIKDGGPDAAHAEVWTATFRDNWSNGSRWKLVQLPFSAFTLADDSLQHGSDTTRDGVLNLTSTWGLSVDLPTGTAATPYSIDDVGLYGTPQQFTDISVSVPDVTLVNAGDTAHVALTLTTASGKATTAATAVKCATGTTAAVNGTDYTSVNTTVTFPAGTASGTTMTCDVPTLAGAAQAEALQIPLTITNAAITLPLTAPLVVINAHGFPYLDSSLPVATRVQDLLGRMSLADKVGQMTQAERGSMTNPRQISQLGLGSLLSGGGSLPSSNTPDGWASMIDGFQREALAAPLQIPLVYGADAVHGHSNVKDATIYPHNIGLGATRDPALVQQIGEETASETRTTGVTWAFAPCLCVSRDERWGRTYESYGEDPALVSSFAGDVVKGLQGSDATDKSAPDEVLASAKHWAGDGGTSYDASKAGTGAYPIDQGITNVTSQQQFESLFATPYVPAINAGIGTIMPSYSSLSINGSTPIKMTANKSLDTDLLKQKMGFSGFLISDWQAIGQLPDATYADKAVTAVNAGLDMAMEPTNYASFISAITDGVTSGKIAQTRIDDAVSRILTQKFELGLFEKPFTNTSQRDQFGGAAHRATAAQAAAESQVLLKNTHDALPLAKTGKLYVAGSNADDLGNQMGGWTLSWQGGSGKGMTAGTTILDGIKADAPHLDVTYSKTATAATSGYDEGLVVVGETPYAEGQGDVGNNGHTLNLSAADTQAINTVCGAMKCVVLVVSGRPQLISSVVPNADAVVAGFLPGSEGEGVASVLLGDEPFTGRLSLSWPASMNQIPVNVGDANYDPEFPYGWGLRTDTARQRLTALVGGLDGSARTAVQALLDADVWGADGSLADHEVGLRLVANAAQALSQVDQSVVDAVSVETAQQHPLDPVRLQQSDTVVSLARDLAQSAIVAQGADPAAADVSATANAEHDLESGDAYDAVKLLASVAGVDVTTTEAPAPTNTTLPSIAGTAQVGQTLTANPGAWSVQGVTPSYQWKADGSSIEGATGATYVPTADVLGKAITVTVTVSKAGYADSDPATSLATLPVVAAATPALTSTAAPRIGGTPQVGVALRATPGSWNAAGVTLSYQWLASGRPIVGATRATYTPTVGDVGERLSVTVTAHKAGYADGRATSAPSAPVAPGVIGLVHAPSIKGKAKVGKRLTAKPGSWSVSGVTVHYQWYASGRRIAGATGSKLTLHNAQAGKRITVKVTVSRSGYASASASSRPTGKVKRS
ncbi:glycoside hydrolase family 3 N-terminal domain-containing protein [Nocardioides sp. BP30]|uniref:glycoside hydrolase family 3 N-terminal domain-containing protein n=1 Tax=Nocardioides sp. BP30 TaxID=3036374 RepID=UPI0024690103|nr:glycoside hydrolase family 3 N-terminal domain-containing protein [Nocardioides sp. BP30]WGL52826.1 glycoside hydrolase family 3 N-terminal domain-containing protein [Nocardioides sp. BP30]